MIEIDAKELTTIRYAQGLASKIVGGIVGGGTTLLTFNPVLGAVVGVSVAHTLETVGKEVIERHLSARQEVRVGRAVAIAFGKLEEFAGNGRAVRDDGFFDNAEGARSAGAEVTEATLFAAMNSAEEKKVDFIATLLANIATTTTIDEPTAHLLISHAERLSFRAYMLLKILGDRGRFELPIRDHQGDDVTNDVPGTLAGLEVELYGFVQNGFVDMKDTVDSTDAYAILGSDTVDPGRLHLTSFGQLLHDTLGLSEMAETNDFEAVLTNLRRLGAERRSARVIDGSTF